MKKLNVIVPIYNVEAYLRQCLDSLVNQHYEDMQVICVNDGTEDNSQQIVDEYVRLYPDLFISLIKENGGLGDARNYGVMHSESEYILFLDSDDFYQADSIADLMLFCEAEKADCVLFDYRWYINEEDQAIRHSLAKEMNSISPRAYILSDPSACMKLIKRAAYVQCGIEFPKRLWYEDLATTLAYVKGCQRFAYYPHPLYCYRQRDNSIMNQMDYNPRMMEILDALNLLLERVERCDYKMEFEYVCSYQIVYQMSLRLLKYNKYEELKKCLIFLNQRFPDWMHNVYYQQKPRLFKLYCFMIKHHQFRLAKFLIKMRG